MSALRDSGQAFMGGNWTRAGGEPFRSLNPATRESIWEGATATDADLEMACAYAEHALPRWADAAFEYRENIVKTFAAALDANKQDLARAISIETGKPLWEAMTEVSAMLAKVDVSIKAFHERSGVREHQNKGVTQRVWHKPHGLVAVFGPFNFPGHLPNGHIIPALLAGNCVIFKPSEQTPLVGEMLVRLWVQAGIPSGILQLLQGDQALGEAIADCTRINGLFFTGSSSVGQTLAKKFSDTPGRILALEMGGNNPIIVGSQTRDLTAVIHDIVTSAFITAGQRCTCARRLLIQTGDVGDELVSRLAEMTERIEPGAWDANPSPFMGSMISDSAARAVMRAQESLILAGGRPLVSCINRPDASSFVTPGIIECSHITQLPDEEIFGPLLKIIRYETFDEAIATANDTRFGLSAALLTDNETEWKKFRLRIRAGIVNWNRPTTGAAGTAPFGGIGASGNHRPGAYYAADYCAYPVASMEADHCSLPAEPTPGLNL